jgi:hypothetical protein
MKNCGISQKTFNLIFGHPVTPKRKCPGQARAFRFVAGARDVHHCKIDPLLEELLHISILEDLR